jgi:hypothetical protein
MYSEEIKKAFAAIQKDHDAHKDERYSSDLEYSKAERRATRIYNGFRKACEKEGLDHFKVYADLSGPSTIIVEPREKTK